MSDTPDTNSGMDDDDQIAVSLDLDDDTAEPDQTLGLNLDFGPDEGEEVSDDGVLLTFGDDEPREATAEDVAHNLFAEDEEEAPAEEAPSLEMDQAIEAAMAELHSELLFKEGDWYVVHTYSGMENRVKQNIDSRVKSLNMEDFIFETVVPVEEVTEVQRSGQKKNVIRTVLPGYVLVRMEMTGESWSVVRHTPSVTGFVGHDANNPVPLSLQEVEDMLRPSVLAKVAATQIGQAARQRKKVEVVDFQVGNNVMVTDGPFAGVHATITEINVNTQRIRALVEILGRETPVDLTFGQIAKVF